MGDWVLHLGDALAVLPTLEAGSVDSLCTDPPAGIAFMNLEFDTFPLRPRGELPGGKLPKQTPHKYGRGFANGMHIDGSKRGRDSFIAFLSAVARECLRVLKPGAYGLVWAIPRTSHWTATALEDAGFEIRDRITHLFGQGFPKAKSCLKPAAEDWWLVRKPGRGVKPLPGLDGCRIGYQSEADQASAIPQGKATAKSGALAGGVQHEGARTEFKADNTKGRWPANVVLDSEAAVLLDQSVIESGQRCSRGDSAGVEVGDFRGWQKHPSGHREAVGYGNGTPGASRFFFCAKADRAERGDGNSHPTVKPLDLMRWLVRLITPPGGRVLDPFAGSGTTLLAATQFGFGAIGIEQNPEYVTIARRRLASAGLVKDDTLPERPADALPLFGP